ncbi:helix-turn-helix domain-containing protein [Streptomyces halobius]|uniref:GntR family transcriptional regulator n=1 Tax=Streptomyces halobius TaxID=2879846 RepID=A0ABY4M3S9_9ACTN|nr:GntR family transcriptional regulator [Streptomyces halobius]UQA92419.1 GntR family transcriptional regulator [Streptomyces halobius]
MTDTSPCVDRPRQIADCLRELIAAGACPPGTPLSLRAVLARNLVSADPSISDAIRILIDDGTLIRYPGKRPLVRPTIPTRAEGPPSSSGYSPNPPAPRDRWI